MRKIQIEYMLFKKTIKNFNYLFKRYSQSNFGNFIAFYYLSKKNIYKPIGKFMRYSLEDLKGFKNIS